MSENPKNKKSIFGIFFNYRIKIIVNQYYPKKYL